MVHTHWYKCPDCGYEWRSSGTGKRIKCPACFEKRTGKKLGGSAEHMAKMREARAAKKAAAKEQLTPPAAEQQPPIPQPKPAEPPAPKPEKSWFAKLLDKEIF